MLVTPLMATIGAAGIAFYVYFLMALRKECKHTVRCWVRLRVNDDQAENHELHEEQEVWEEVLRDAA